MKFLATSNKMLRAKWVRRTEAHLVYGPANVPRNIEAVGLNGRCQFLSGNAFFTASKKGDNPVAFVGKDLILSGFAFPGNTERLLAGSAWATVESAGRGKVVLFADDPLFRGFWADGQLLFANAVFGLGAE